jgi:hypothetical protein
MEMEHTLVHFIAYSVNHVGGAYCYTVTAGFKLVISEHLLCKGGTKRTKNKEVKIDIRFYGSPPKPTDSDTGRFKKNLNTFKIYY